MECAFKVNFLITLTVLIHTVQPLQKRQLDSFCMKLTQKIHSWNTPDKSQLTRPELYQRKASEIHILHGWQLLSITCVVSYYLLIQTLMHMQLSHELRQLSQVKNNLTKPLNFWLNKLPVTAVCSNQCQCQHQTAPASTGLSYHETHARSKLKRTITLEKAPALTLIQPHC